MKKVGFARALTVAFVLGLGPGTVAHASPWNPDTVFVAD